MYIIVDLNQNENECWKLKLTNKTKNAYFIECIAVESFLVRNITH